MSQYNPGDLESPLSGTSFINTHFEPTVEALETNHSGPSTPSYVKAGMIWVNTTTDPWVLNIYDGAANIALGTVNIADNLFIPSNQIKWGGTAAGTAQALTITPSPAITAYTAGMAYEFIVNTPNTAENPTININGKGAKTIKCYIGSGKANLPKGALQGLSRIVYDGTDFVLINIRPHNNASSIATAATVNLNNANGDYVELTGTTTVTDITLDEGQEKTVKCAESFTLTDGSGNSPQDIILPGSADITTATGDVFIIRGEGNGTTRIVGYMRADGSPLNGAAGGWEPVATASPSGVATVDFDDLFEAEYIYKVIWSNIHPSADGWIFACRLAGVGNSYLSGSGDYEFAYNNAGTTTGTEIRLTGNTGVGNDATEQTSGELTLIDPMNTTYPCSGHFHVQAENSSNSLFTTSGVLNFRNNSNSLTPEAVDSIRFFFLSGNIDDGEIRVYRRPL